MSSRSATVATSIQHSGTATTTSAKPKPSFCTKRIRVVGVGNVFADQILAGDAKMNAAGLQGFCDLADET